MKRKLLLLSLGSVLAIATAEAQFVTTPAGFARPANGFGWFKLPASTYTSATGNTGADGSGSTRFGLALPSAVTNGCPTIQIQLFASPGSGACNVQGDASGTTVSSTQSRKVTLNAWNNTNPTSGVAAGATSGTIWTATSAKIKILGGTGTGGSDDTFSVIGGFGSGNNTRLIGTTFWTMAWADSRFSQSGTGAEGSLPLNNNDPTFGMAEPGSGNTNTKNFLRTPGSAYTAEMVIPLNNAQLGAGGTTDVTFTANVGIRNFSREFGNADGRIGFNPGMRGEAQMEVVYDVFEIRPNAAQPVELTAFNLRGEGRSVVAEWETASERDNSYFSLERSADVRSFEAVGRVDGKGTTASVSKYVFEDKNPMVGINYYRLRQVDLNGTFTFSAVKSYTVRESGALAVLPNPTADYLTVNGLTEVSKLQIVDMTGRVRLEKQAEKASTTVDISGLQPGVYFARIIEGGQSQSLKFVVSR